MSVPALLAEPSQATLIWLATTVVLGGPAAFAAGAAVARRWKGLALTTFYAALIAAATCFLSYALFGVVAVSLQNLGASIGSADWLSASFELSVWAAGFVALAGLAGLGWRITRARCMGAQYGFENPRDG